MKAPFQELVTSRHICNLKTHLLIHTGETPSTTHSDYLCSRSGNLKTHMLIHSGERPFRCDLCNFSCTRANDLKTHNLKHTGENPVHVSSATSLAVTLMV